MSKELMKITPKVKRDIKLWIQKLRSGRFSQTHGTLQDGNGYCCLGVACKVVIPRHKLTIEDFTEFLKGGMPDEQTYAPEWLQKISDDFELRTGESLPTLNDDGVKYDVSESEYEDGDFSDGEYVEDESGTGKYEVTETLTFNEIADMLQLVYLEGAV